MAAKPDKMQSCVMSSKSGSGHSHREEDLINPAAANKSEIRFVCLTATISPSWQVPQREAREDPDDEQKV